ncbi:hypothetical protein RSOLAG22IIIB_05764 [Rhizoctonia solani]|uniref:Uncharacterized protein n=1 Tax=Rhizoctonia solani TaxID=456999 RepID=A0A0K6GA01_9AGAM|nr:hypothetical protein RSOLAG22IIIB_05764 [Rhizoctonia solani]
MSQANVDHLGPVPNNAVGMSREYPDEESTLLREEFFFHEEGTLFGRVLNSFEFCIHGKPVAVQENLIRQDGSSDLEVIGMVGTIYNKEGLFGQCGWFGNYDLDWFWVRMNGITAIKVDKDLRFRRGEWCIWLHTRLGQYALLLPRATYRETWEEVVSELGPNGLSALFRQWPACGTRPSWWDEKWKDDWPFEKEAGSKRRASTELGQFEVEARESDGLTSKWKFLGPRGEQGNQGEMRTTLDQLCPWELSPSGMLPTRLNKSKSSDRLGTETRGKATSTRKSRGVGKSSKRKDI